MILGRKCGFVFGSWSGSGGRTWAWVLLAHPPLIWARKALTHPPPAPALLMAPLLKKRKVGRASNMNSGTGHE